MIFGILKPLSKQHCAILNGFAIDSFKTNKLSFRPVGAPFFNNTKCILKYALTSKDSLLTDFHDFGDSLLFSLTIYSDKQVEFHGKPVYNKNAPNTYNNQ